MLQKNTDSFAERDEVLSIKMSFPEYWNVCVNKMFTSSPYMLAS